jgi:hypothetical protein
MDAMSTEQAPPPNHTLAGLAARWREFWNGYWRSPHGC